MTKHAKERVHMQQRSSVFPTKHWEKETGWMETFLITSQRIARISYMSTESSKATSYHDKWCTIFLTLEVFRQFVVHTNGKMPEAAVDPPPSLLSKTKNTNTYYTKSPQYKCFPNYILAFTVTVWIVFILHQCFAEDFTPLSQSTQVMTQFRRFFVTLYT